MVFEWKIDGGMGPLNLARRRGRERESQSASRGGAQKEDRGLACWVVMSSSTCCYVCPACLFIWLRPTIFEVFFSLKILNILKITFTSKNKWYV